MANTASSSSSQLALLISLESTATAGTLCNLQSADGTVLFTIAPVKEYQSVSYSSSSLANGETYLVYTGGSCTGTLTNGVYSGGKYSGGTLYLNFTIIEYSN